MKLGENLKLALDADLKFSMGPNEEAEWAIEYRRIGRKYASWGAIFAIFGIPSILLSEMHNTYEDPQLWLFYRMLPSVVIGIAFILFITFKYSHEILFLVIAYSLFLCFSYWPDCNALDKFLYGQLTMFIPIAFITMLRPFYFVINFVVHLVLLSVFYSYYCQHDVVTFFSSKEFVPILITSISSFIVASFRYFLAKRNFIFNILLRDALFVAEAERKKSDELLKNILPAEMAEELKASGTVKAKAFTMVTVMFTDFKDFTTVSEKVSAELLVAEIHHCFSAFDQILQKYKIEKIKTIGDSYMCASGLPISNYTHAKDMVNAAFEIRNFMLGRKKEKEANDEISFELRIGINTGSVVAGIVGIKKFAYDIWGDTVNLATRMEQNSEAGKINISGSTYELVKDKFKCEYRGKIQAKNKGEIDMYFVESVS